MKKTKKDLLISAQFVGKNSPYRITLIGHGLISPTIDKTPFNLV
jgi:hypothetical protein